MTDREKFEQLAQMPPRCWCVKRYEKRLDRAGEYMSPSVQTAWEFWQAGHDAAMAEIDEMMGGGRDV